MSKIQEYFDSLDDYVEINTYDRDSGCCLHIRWVLNGVGFGELVLAYDTEKKKWYSDTECMKKEMIERILKLAVPKLADKYLELDKCKDENF